MLGLTAVLAASYVRIIVVLRLTGKRTLAKLDAFDFVVTIAIGSTLSTVAVSQDVPFLDGMVTLLGLVVLQLARAMCPRDDPATLTGSPHPDRGAGEGWSRGGPFISDRRRIGAMAMHTETHTDRRRGHGDVEQLAEQRSKSRAGLAGFVVGALVTVAIALLVLQNRSEVQFEWLVFDFDTPLWLMLGLSFVAGILAGPLLLGAWRHRRNVRERRKAVAEQARLDR
jgi:uncharacterized integral membrane protein